jgi:hypothetical protein
MSIAISFLICRARCEVRPAKQSGPIAALKPIVKSVDHSGRALLQANWLINAL